MKNETQSALVARDAAIILLLIWAFMQALLMIWAPADTQTTYLLLLFLMDIAVLCGFMDRVNTGTALAATITCGWVAYKLYSFYAVGETVYLTDYFVTVLPLLGSGAAALFSRSMRHVNAENKLLRRQVDEQVLVDDVTELYNLRAMYRDAQMMTGYCVRNHLPISLMIIQMRYESELRGMLSHSRYIQLRKRLAELERLVQSTYEDKVKGLIPEAVCIELLNKYQTERTEKAAQLEELERRIEDSQTVQNDVQEWVSLIRQYRNLESLDRETLLRLIDKIEIGEQRIVDGLKEREILIYYKFVGYIG